mmetsp:Transcript_10203/g.12379  ORF Transcript_10203/g.12379 Transcript_10203/m.12379 type:complete len:198 (+) Transcript_10203:160-753(+)
MFEITNMNINFIGDWDGTGKCSTFHGESDCYADTYNLCGAAVAPANKSWAFTHCMYANQQALCADTVTDDGECGAGDYHAEYFDPVVGNCSDIAEFTSQEYSDLSACAIDADTGTMAQEGIDLLVNSFKTSTNDNPSPMDMWVAVGNHYLVSTNYENNDDWAIAVRDAVCAVYQMSNPNDDSLPTICNPFATTAKKN